MKHKLWMITKMTSLCTSHFKNYPNMTAILMLSFSVFASSSKFKHKYIFATFMSVLFLVKKVIHSHCRALVKYSKHVMQIYPTKI